MFAKIKKRSLNKKILLIAVLVLAIAAGAGAYALSRSDSGSETKNTTAKEGKTNFAPPTAEEEKAGDDIKSEIVNEQQNQASQPSTGGKKAVVPTVTYAGQYGNQIEVGAYVSNLFEDGGTCTLELKKDGVTKSVSVQGVKNVNSVDCPVMAIDRSQLPSSGKWQAVVSYSSASSEGSSEIKYFEVR